MLRHSDASSQARAASKYKATFKGGEGFSGADSGGCIPVMKGGI